MKKMKKDAEEEAQAEAAKVNWKAERKTAAQGSC